MASLLSKRLSSEPVSKVEVHVSCDKLLNRDVTSKSDPCCLLYMMTGGKWLEVSSWCFCVKYLPVLNVVLESILTSDLLLTNLTLINCP